MRGCLGGLSIFVRSLSTGWPSPSPPSVSSLRSPGWVLHRPCIFNPPTPSTYSRHHTSYAHTPVLHVPPMPWSQAQTSTSCGPGTAVVAATPMSKQVTIMTWALHRLTHCSRAAVACSRATRYSADSGSSSGSTSTGEKETVSGQGSGQQPGSSNSSRKVSGQQIVSSCLLLHESSREQRNNRPGSRV